MEGKTQGLVPCRGQPPFILWHGLPWLRLLKRGKEGTLFCLPRPPSSLLLFPPPSRVLFPPVCSTSSHPTLPITSSFPFPLSYVLVKCVNPIPTSRSLIRLSFLQTLPIIMPKTRSHLEWPSHPLLSAQQLCATPRATTPFPFLHRTLL